MGKKIKTVKEWLGMKALRLKLQKKLEDKPDASYKNSIQGIIEFLDKKISGKS